MCIRGVLLRRDNVMNGKDMCRNDRNMCINEKRPMNFFSCVLLKRDIGMDEKRHVYE